MPNLKEADLRGTGVTEKGAAALRTSTAHRAVV